MDHHLVYKYIILGTTNFFLTDSKQIHKTKNIRNPSRRQIRPFCSLSRLQNHHLRRQRSQRQNIPRPPRPRPRHHDLAPRTRRNRLTFSQIRSFRSFGQLNQNFHLRRHQRKRVLQRSLRFGPRSDGLDPTQVLRSHSLQKTRSHSLASWNQYDRSRRFLLRRVVPKSSRFQARNPTSVLLPQRYPYFGHLKIRMGKSSGLRNPSPSSLRSYRQHQRSRHHLLRRLEHKLRRQRVTKLHPSPRHRLLHSFEHRQRTHLGKRQVLRSTTSESIRTNSYFDRSSYLDLRGLGV